MIVSLSFVPLMEQVHGARHIHEFLENPCFVRDVYRGRFASPAKDVIIDLRVRIPARGVMHRRSAPSSPSVQALLLETFHAP